MMKKIVFDSKKELILKEMKDFQKEFHNEFKNGETFWKHFYKKLEKELEERFLEKEYMKITPIMGEMLFNHKDFGAFIKH